MENLGIDGKLLIAQLINFVLFFFIFKKYISKPFMKFLNLEKEREKEKEALLKKLEKGEEELLKKEIAMKQKMKKEAAEIVERAKKDALLVGEEIISSSKQEAEAIKSKAIKGIDEERSKLYEEVKDKVATLSILIVEKAMSDYLDEDSKKRITKSILSNLTSSVTKNEN